MFLNTSFRDIHPHFCKVYFYAWNFQSVHVFNQRVLKSFSKMLYQFTFMPTVYEYSGCLMFFQHLVLSLTFSPCVCVCVCDISLMTNNLEYLSYISIWISDVFAFSIEFSAFFLIIDEFLIFLNMRLLTELLVSWPTLVLPFHSLSGIFW